MKPTNPISVDFDNLYVIGAAGEWLTRMLVRPARKNRKVKRIVARQLIVDGDNIRRVDTTSL